MSRRAMIVGGAAAAVALVATAVVLMVTNNGGLADGRQRWQDSRPDAYRMVVTVDCFCPLRGTWQLFVDGGRVDVEPPDDSEVAVDRIDPPTVDRLYSRAIGRLDRASVWPWLRPTVEATIDPSGIPVDVRLDEAGVDDDEFGWTIEEFTPR